MSIWSLKTDNVLAHLHDYSSYDLVRDHIPYVKQGSSLYRMLYETPHYGFHSANDYYDGSPVDDLHSKFDMLVLL